MGVRTADLLAENRKRRAKSPLKLGLGFFRLGLGSFLNNSSERRSSSAKLCPRRQDVGAPVSREFHPVRSRDGHTATVTAGASARV